MESLKLSKKDREELTSIEAASDVPQYPWGTRIHLEDEQVTLFPELKGAKVGDELVILAKVHVMSVSESEREDEGGGKNKSQSVELQITDMEFEGTASDDAGKAGRLYKGQDSAPVSRPGYQPPA